MNNLLIAQSGGPTAAINATLLGIFQRAMTSSKVDKVYGGIHGIKGILEGNIREIGHIMAGSEVMENLPLTPSAALGSCRHKLDEKDKNYTDTLEKILEIFREYDIKYFVYIGGNDSMDTVMKLDKFFKSRGADDIFVMGAPKTIDNDLCVTDHTPGFGTAAKFIAVTMAELFCDIRVYDYKQVIIVETMGRDSGWLAAATCLSGINGGDSPHLIYLPEVAFDTEQFLEEIRSRLVHQSYVVAVVSEGIKDKDGRYICEQGGERHIDAFGHPFLTGACKYLEKLVKENIKVKVRSIDFSLMQRCSSHMASLTDIEESKMLGEAALDRALNGCSGEMSYVERLSNTPYRIAIKTSTIDQIANQVKTVPLEWLNEERNNVNDLMFEYLRPLIQGECAINYLNGIPEHVQLY